MLTKPQVKFLLEANCCNGIYAVDTYPPVLKLANLGFIESIKGRWYITKLGKDALQALQREEETPKKMQKYRVISPMLQSDDPQIRRQAVVMVEPALRETHGNIMQTAKLIGVSHRQMCRWLTMSEELQRLTDDLRNEQRRQKC